jgi:hypothetical protein
MPSPPARRLPVFSRVRLARNSVVFSPDTRPRYDAALTAVGNGPTSSIAATKRAAVTGPQKAATSSLLTKRTAPS